MDVQRLKTALDGLQSDAQNRSFYNSELQTWQRSPEAWSTTFMILADTQCERTLRIFAAQTLRYKIAYDLHQVPHESRSALKDRVLELLELNVDLVSVVGSQLCVALAAFAMQVVTWKNVIEEMTTKFRNPALIPPLFEFLRVLPEEFSSSRYTMTDPDRRAARATELIQGNANTVLNFMMREARNLQDEHKVLFFEALNPWIPEVNISELVDSPIIDWIFAALGSEETMEVATDCLCTLIHETDEVHEPNIQSAIAVLYPKILELGKYSSLYAENPEIHRNMTRILSRAGEDWHMLVCERPKDFLALVEAVVSCVKVPNIDLEVVGYTFNFFDRLGMMLVLPLYDDARSYVAEKFLELMEAFTVYLRYPTGNNVATLFQGNKEEEDKFKDFRYEVGDMLKICCSILGSERALETCIKRLSAILDNSHSVIQWQDVEAILFSIRAIARNVNSNSRRFPDVVNLFPRLPAHEKITHAALLLIGRYSFWTAYHPEFLEIELDYLIKGINSKIPEVVRAAAHSFLFICQDCASDVARAAPALFTFYNQLSGKIDLDSQAKIADGIGIVLAVYDHTTLRGILESLTSPVIEKLKLFLANPASGINLDEMSNDLQCLCMFAANVSVADEDLERHPVTQLVMANHELVLQFFVQYGSQHIAAVRSTMKYYIVAIQHLRQALYPLIPSLLQAVAVLSNQLFFPIYCELGGAVAHVFNKENKRIKYTEVKSVVWPFCESLGNKALFACSSANSIRDVSKELVDSLYGYFSDLVVFFTDEFVLSDLFDRSIQLLVEALSLDDNNVLYALSAYIEDVSTYFDWSVLNEAGKTPEELRSARISEIINKYGEAMMRQIFAGYLWHYDDEYMPRANSVVDFIFWVCPVVSLDWLKNISDALPEGTVSAEEKFEIIQRVFSQMSQRNFKGIGFLICQFGKAYRQRAIAPR